MLLVSCWEISPVKTSKLLIIYGIGKNFTKIPYLADTRYLPTNRKTYQIPVPQINIKLVIAEVSEFLQIVDMNIIIDITAIEIIIVINTNWAIELQMGIIVRLPLTYFICEVNEVSGIDLSKTYFAPASKGAL